MKTGKINTQGEYDQLTDGKAIRFAEWDSTSPGHPESVGMIRYNVDDDRLELRTVYGWRHIITSKDTGSSGGDSLKDGIIKKVQTAKKIKQMSLYFQGVNTSDATNLIDYRNQNNQDPAMPGWMTKTTTTAQDGTSYVSKLNNEGDDVYLFVDDGTQGTVNCNIQFDIPSFMGIAAADKYNWRYNVVCGLNGYGFMSMYGSDLRATARCVASHTPPTPDFTGGNDTSPNYGRFTGVFNFEYGTNSTKTSQYNGNYNLLVLAKKFKGF